MSQLERRTIIAQPDAPAPDAFGGVQPANEPGPSAEEATTMTDASRARPLRAFREQDEDEIPTEIDEQQADAVVKDEPRPHLALVGDQDTQEVAQNRQEIVLNTMRTLDRYRAHLESTQGEITSNLEQLTRWYHKFTDRYKQQKAFHQEVGNALERVSQLMATATQYDAAKKAQVELFQLQEELHTSGVVPFTEKMGTIEIAPDAPEMDWQHADALGKSMEIQEPGEPILEYQMAGFAKDHGKNHVGEYGQDSAIVNPTAGIVVQIDGSTALGPESYRAGIVYGEKVHDILGGIPGSESDPSAIKEYVRKRYTDEMQTVLDWMSHTKEEAGGAVMVAMRVLPEVGLVVAFRIGDGHMAMKQGEDATEVLPEQKASKTSRVRGVGITLAGGAGIKVMNAQPSIEVYRFDPSQDLELFAVSDGLDKLEGKPTVSDVLAKGGVEEIKRMGKPEQTQDDMLAVHLRYKGR